MLITHSGMPGISGLSNPMDQSHVRDHDDYIDFTACAFSIIDVGSFETGDYVFAHELGHVMGAQHNAPSQAGAVPLSSFGYTDESPATSTQCGPWLTIMAERRQGLCPMCQRAPLWSNTDSDIKFCDETVGNENARNRDTLEHTAFTTANFYCGATRASDVWIKDTWGDTGTEPDPATAAEPMWKSPYIWIRRLQDPPPYKYRHLSEIPLVNETNYVYVKVHNGGAAATGQLELWVARAATGLQWPGDFSAVGTPQTVTLDANRTRIFEFPWPADNYGSHSFITRWESTSDQMAQPEGNNVEANARANNNIAWRNVSVIDLVGGRDTSITTTVQNIEQTPERVLILIRPSDPNPDHSIFKHGQATIKLDRALMTAWRSGRYQGKGFRRVPFRGIQITDPNGATLEGLILKPGELATLTVTVRSSRDSPLRGTFLVDVIQRQQQGRGVRDVGGTTFEIRATGR